MRHDMTKVFHEPGRDGCKFVKGEQRGWQAERRYGQSEQGDWQGEQCDWQGVPVQQPTFEPMHRNWKRDRNASYSPLRRYLRAQVGRRWDAVYSDICHETRGNSLPNKELLHALSRMVEQHVQVIDGQPYDSDGREIWADFTPVWIHPETGIVMISPARARRSYKHRTEFTQFVIDELHKLVLINNLWFVVTFAILPESWPGIPASDIPCDLLRKEPALNSLRGKFKREWGSDIYAIAKRSANRREIRRIVTTDSK